MSRTAQPEISRLLRRNRGRILRLAAKYGARRVRLFGSVARGEATAKSDVDFLVHMDRGRSYLDLVGLWQDLGELLGRKVDVITDRGISPYLRGRILREATPL